MDEKQRPLTPCYSPAARWTIALLAVSVCVNVMFTGWVVIKLTTVETTVDKLERDLVEVQKRQSSADETQSLLDNALSEHGEERVKRLVPSSSPNPRVAVNAGRVFASLVQQICKPDGAICLPGEPGRDGLPGLPGLQGPPG